MHKSALATKNQMISYSRTKIAQKTKEEFHLLFLDRENHIVADEMMGYDTVDHAPVYPRAVIKRMFELSASALTLVHCQPSGDPKLSKADIDMINKLYALTGQCFIVIHDHLILKHVQDMRFKNLGFLKAPKPIFSHGCFARRRQSVKASSKETSNDSALCPSRNGGLMGGRKPLFNLARYRNPRHGCDG